MCFLLFLILFLVFLFFFFFSSRRRHTRWNCDWSSDVCSSDLGSAAMAIAQSQDYPSRPIRFIVPFLAGGGVDVAARILGQKLSDAFRQQIVIESRAGAGGVVGANAAAKAAPDGYTFLFGPGDFVTRPSLMLQMTFDPHKDLVPVAMVSSNPMLVVAGANAPFNNVKELI